MDADELSEITPFAVELRYDPGFWPDRETAAGAVDAAERVRSEILKVLPNDVAP